MRKRASEGVAGQGFLDRTGLVLTTETRRWGARTEGVITGVVPSLICFRRNGFWVCSVHGISPSLLRPHASRQLQVAQGEEIRTEHTKKYRDRTPWRWDPLVDKGTPWRLRLSVAPWLTPVLYHCLMYAER